MKYKELIKTKRSNKERESQEEKVRKRNIKKKVTSKNHQRL